MAALRMDMITKLAKAPKKTVIRGCRVAMIAAIKNVLSPVSVSSTNGQGQMGQNTNFRNDNHDECVKQGGWLVSLIPHRFK
jgi:hypothetical protein